MFTTDPCLLRDHVWQHRAREVVRAEQRHLDALLPLVGRRFEDGVELAEMSGVVAQHVDAARVRGGQRHRPRHVVDGRDVARAEPRPGRLAREWRRRPLRPPRPSTSTSVTWAPSSAKHSLMARPMPCAAPVTIATLPSSRFMARGILVCTAAAVNDVRAVPRDPSSMLDSARSPRPASPGRRRT